MLIKFYNRNNAFLGEVVSETANFYFVYMIYGGTPMPDSSYLVEKSTLNSRYVIDRNYIASLINAHDHNALRRFFDSKAIIPSQNKPVRPDKVSIRINGNFYTYDVVAENEGYCLATSLADKPERRAYWLVELKRADAIRIDRRAHEYVTHCVNKDLNEVLDNLFSNTPHSPPSVYQSIEGGVRINQSRVSQMQEIEFTLNGQPKSGRLVSETTMYYFVISEGKHFVIEKNNMLGYDIVPNSEAAVRGYFERGLNKSILDSLLPF